MQTEHVHSSMRGRALYSGRGSSARINLSLKFEWGTFTARLLAGLVLYNW